MNNFKLSATALGVALLAGCGGGAVDTTMDVAAAPVVKTQSAQRAAVGDSFGLSTDATFYTIDTGAGLVFKVRRFDNRVSTQSAGDIHSMVYKGVQYQNATRGTQINSGFDWMYKNTSAVTVDAVQVDNDHIKVTVKGGNLTHYYIVKRGVSNIYMGTYFTTEPDTLGLVRFIVRVPRAVLPFGPEPSNLDGTNGAIESGDIFGRPDGQTRSKHYSNMRLKDWQYIGATSPTAGIHIVRDNHEGGSGGPFYRSLLNQGGSDQELTYIVNYGEAQTEAFRMGVLNSYTMVFGNGTPPGPVDTSFFSKLDLLGYVPPSARGNVFVPAIAGRDPAHAYTVGFANAKAQYWGDAASTSGQSRIDGMMPGDYLMTVYKNELAVYSEPVTVTAGTTKIVPGIVIRPDSLVPNTEGNVRGKWHLANGDPSMTRALFRIGDWDGTPTEFLNGDKVTTMHPQDIRMSNWLGSATEANPYLIGTSAPATHFPAFQWKGLSTAPNGPVVIKFNLKPSQISAAATYKFRIGVTATQGGGRPQINVNDWWSPFMGSQSGDWWSPGQPKTRMMTVGTYRGLNITYDFTIPSSSLVAGQNTLKVFVVSGSTSGSRWLTPGVSFDALDLIKAQ